MSRRVIVGVMGPGEGASPDICRVARVLGEKIARAGWVLLTGGRNVGVMRAATVGAHQAGGLTIGILPEATPAAAVPELDIVIPTGLGQARNVINVLASQVVVGCGWGAGTTSELALAIKFGKPVILLEMPLVAQTFFQHLSPQVHLAQTPDEVISYISTRLTTDSQSG
ncbi:MAG: hypothetical protein RMI89_07090 [Gloeomargarita sp. SKYBB_i_bin120]|nr:hypothetical protein [Gloeomargarita sp. SKYG98]MCS7292724.1 hypothetical protein [Gloeomargarita sp. SKYB120]MDW8178287.1 hypothetical protein [Gloeomargarita sp. SKYBB_i_bin120]